MIEIKPNFEISGENIYKAFPAIKGKGLKFERLAWTGMNTCAVFSSDSSNEVVYEVLSAGHNLTRPCLVMPNANEIYLTQASLAWMGQPLLKALQNPSHEEIVIRKEILRDSKQVILLNCIDFLYGHCLLKLLNAQRHLGEHVSHGLVVIVPKFLRWMVPEGVSEIWTVEIPLSNGQRYYLALDRFISTELNRFEHVLLSESFLHPSSINISDFTKVEKHRLSTANFRISYIWREDRLWIDPLLSKLSRGFKKHIPLDFGVILQGVKVKRLLCKLKQEFPNAKLTVVGLGKQYRFPDWIEDCRVNSFTVDTEKRFCEIYAQSRVVIGLHGSNMLLPSAHSGMTVNLLPDSRIGNFCQDILYHESNVRIAAFRYRFLPANLCVSYIVNTVSSMVRNYAWFSESMTMDLP